MRDACLLDQIPMEMIGSFRNKSRYSATFPVMEMTGGDGYDNFYRSGSDFYKEVDKFFVPEGIKLSLPGSREVRVRGLKVSCDSKSLREKCNHSSNR